MERTEGEHHTPDMGSEQVNLLISLLIRFPQVSAVHYDRLIAPALRLSFGMSQEQLPLCRESQAISARRFTVSPKFRSGT